MRMRGSSSQRSNVKNKLIGEICQETDEEMWNCQVCLYILRLELRLEFGIVSKNIYF